MQWLPWSNRLQTEDDMDHAFLARPFIPRQGIPLVADLVFDQDGVCQRNGSVGDQGVLLECAFVVDLQVQGFDALEEITVEGFVPFGFFGAVRAGVRFEGRVARANSENIIKE